MSGPAVMVCWVQQAGGCCGRGEDLGPVPVEFHRRGAERAADFPGGGGAGVAAVAVGVVGGVEAEFVAGELSSLLVVGGGVGGGGAGRQRHQFQ